MGLAKKLQEVAQTFPVDTKDFRATPLAVESGVTAALDRLSKKTEKAEPKPQYKARDYEAEAQGKVRCVMFEAALQSPALAGLPFNTLEEYLILVAKAADAGVAYTWK